MVAKLERLIICLIFISLIFLQFSFTRFWLGGLYVPITAFFILAALFLLVLRFVSTGKIKNVNLFLVASLLFTLSLFFSVLGQPNPKIFRIGEYIFYLLIPLLFINFIDDFKFIRKIIWILFGCGTILCLVAFYNLQRGGSVWWLEFGGVGTRTSGAFIFECIFILILSYFLYASDKKILTTVLIIISLILLGSGIILSLSRGAWLSTFAGVVVLMILNAKSESKGFRRIKPALKYIFLGGTVVFFLLFIVSSEVKEKITERTTLFGRGGDFVRWEIYRASFQSIADHPLKGVGVGNFMEEVDVKSPYGVQLLHAHNAYLNIWVEQGVLGVLALIVLILFPLISLIRLRGYFSGKGDEWIIAGMTGVLCIISIHFLFESFYNFIFFWIIYGLCLATVQCAKSQKTDG